MSRLLVVVAALVATGCATQGVNSFTYKPSIASTVQNEKIVARPQAIVWDELVRELSKSFYVINNIERESRLINVSFISNSPVEYVDCGRSARHYTQGTKVETFEYAIAAPSTYKFAGQRQPTPSMISYAIVQREPSLEGRSNIYVAPQQNDSTRTIVSVNTRYVLNLKTRGTAFIEGVNSNIIRQDPLPERSTQIIFNTNATASSTDQNATITCFGTGKLELDILNMVKP